MSGINTINISGIVHVANNFTWTEHITL